MFRLFENRYDGPWVFRVGHRADSDGDQCGHAAEFPVDGRAALWTKIVMDFAAACGRVRELFRGPRDGDDLGGVISADAERRACSALAVDAMTGNDDPGWLFWK